MPTRIASVLVMLAVSWTAPRAVETNLDLRAIEEALALGRTGIAVERTRFHDPYRVYVAKAPVDYFEVITPFRRIVIAAQGRAAIGDRGFGQRQALDIIATAGERLDIYIELTFHPLNTLIGVPAYEIALIGSQGTRLGSQTLDRVSRWTPRVDGLPPAVPTPGGIVVAPRSQPLLGGSVNAGFDLRSLDPKGSYEVVIVEEGEERARAKIDLGKLR